MKKIEFKQAKNGLIMTITHSDGSAERIVYNDSSMRYDDVESEEIARFRDFLWFITDTYGPTTNRYSKERIYIEIRPGDKYEEPSNNS